jgi:hypothetical protein
METILSATIAEALKWTMIAKPGRLLVDDWYLGAAWAFFAFRVLHSIVHCTFYFVPLRFWLYAVSAIALWFMVLRLEGSSRW